MANCGQQLDFRLQIRTLKLVTTATGYVTRIIDSFDVGHNDLEYRAEGNANIVLAIPQRCQVLRLPKLTKSEQNSCCSSLNTTTMAQNESHKRIFHVYKYSASMSALFECNFSTPPILVQLEFHNGSAFNEWLHNRRPQQRIQQYDTKDGFDFEFGLLYRDACTPKLELESAVQSVRRSPGDVITVEIKPKQGWNICSLSGSMLDLLGIVEPVQMKKCRFCAMQCLKSNAITDVSKYCPLDLFSGDLNRTQNALRDLIASPQNNFRVFVNGSLIYGDDSDVEGLQSMLASYFHRDIISSTDVFISLLSRILHYDYSNGSELEVKPDELPTDSNGCTERETCEHSTGSILKSVLDFQLLSQDAIRNIAWKYMSYPSIFNNGVADYERVNELCEKLSSFQPGNGHVSFEYFASKLHLTAEQIYEIGATALDCSIMLTFCKVDNNSNETAMTPILHVDNESYAINATVFDLDPKIYTKHFKKYVEKTKESYHAVSQYTLL